MGNVRKVPVRYLDRLNTLSRRLNMIRYAIEGMDPEAAAELARIERQLSSVLMAINRKGAPRGRYLAEAMR